jgi:hypothetical protein
MTHAEYHATVSALKAVLAKEGKTLEALTDLHSDFGGLTEAQHNTFANAEYKHDEAVKALSKLGVLAVTWEYFTQMHDK